MASFSVYSGCVININVNKRQFLHRNCAREKAHLSHRDRATLRVNEYFAKSRIPDHSRSFEMTLLSRECVSPILVFN